MRGGPHTLPRAARTVRAPDARCDTPVTPSLASGRRIAASSPGRGGKGLRDKAVVPRPRPASNTGLTHVPTPGRFGGACPSVDQVTPENGCP